jgi:hypothetical protein
MGRILREFSGSAAPKLSAHDQKKSVRVIREIRAIRVP